MFRMTRVTGILDRWVAVVRHVAILRRTGSRNYVQRNPRPGHGDPGFYQDGARSIGAAEDAAVCWCR